MDDCRVSITDHELQAFLGYHIKRASNVIQADLARILKPFNLRVLTFSALSLVDENEGLSQSQLADAMGMERPNLVAIVDALEKDGLIQRERAATDRRAYALRMTSKGTDVCSKVRDAVRTHEAQLFQDLDDKARQNLIDAMTRIRHAAHKG